MQHASRSEGEKRQSPPIPGYPGFITLLAFYVLIREKTDITIIETKIGGEHDSTNIFRRPVATGITSLKLDHTNVLENDIRGIAWHKRGIFKPESRAFTVSQDPITLDILRQRSKEKNVAEELGVVDKNVINQYNIRIEPELSYQKLNASLAILLAKNYLKSIDHTFIMTPRLAKCLQNVSLPGRCETIMKGNKRWLLSAAHNKISMIETCRWVKGALNASKYVAIWLSMRDLTLSQGCVLSCFGIQS